MDENGGTGQPQRERKAARGRSVPRTGTARNVQPREHDTYRRRRKPKETTVCKGCGLVFHDGRWSWGPPPPGKARDSLCPACQRIHDRYPVGTVRLAGLPAEHRDEVRRLIRNAEEQERQEHPLERLIDIEEVDGAWLVTTTGMHLARCIAGGLRRRFHGGVAVHYSEGENLVRVDWTG